MSRSSISGSDLSAWTNPCAGGGRPSRLPDPDEAEFAHALLPAPPLWRNWRARAYLVRRIGGRLGGDVADQASPGQPGGAALPVPGAGWGAWVLSTSRASPGSSSAGRAARARGPWRKTGCSTSGINVPAPVLCSSSSNGAGPGPSPAGAGSRAWCMTLCRPGRSGKAPIQRLEEQLDSPTLLVDGGDGRGGEVEIKW